MVSNGPLLESCHTEPCQRNNCGERSRARYLKNIKMKFLAYIALIRSIFLKAWNDKTPRLRLVIMKQSPWLQIQQKSNFKKKH